jgi:hypothetical protein
MRGGIYPTVTALRLEWLKLVAVKPGSVSHNQVGYACRKLGWTDWNYRTRNGEFIDEAEARKRFGDRYWQHVRIAGERLTEAGRRIIEQEEGR